ncbi:LysR Transcriptional regulator [Candidatus Nanopelagicaceae bacterium]
MNLKYCQAFVEVADTAHFGRAAENLKMTQSGLSQMIKALEKEIGVKLLDRTTRTVALTGMGHSLYQHAVELIQAHHRTEERIAGIVSGQQGTVRLGFVPSAALKVLPRFIFGLRSHSPSIFLELHELDSSKQLTHLKEGRIDIGLVRDINQSPGLVISPIMREPLLLAVSRKHRLFNRRSVKIDELREELFVSLPQNRVSYLHNKVTSLCTEAGFTPTVIQEALQFATILGLVSSGVGIAVVPQSASLIQLPDLNFIKIAGVGAYSHIHIARRTNSQTTPAQIHVMDIALSVFK